MRAGELLGAMTTFARTKTAEGIPRIAFVMLLDQKFSLVVTNHKLGRFWAWDSHHRTLDGIVLPQLTSLACSGQFAGAEQNLLFLMTRGGKDAAYTSESVGNCWVAQSVCRRPSLATHRLNSFDVSNDVYGNGWHVRAFVLTCCAVFWKMNSQPSLARVGVVNKYERTQ